MLQNTMIKKLKKYKLKNQLKLFIIVVMSVQIVSFTQEMFK